MVPTLFRTYLQANRSNNIIALSLSLRLPLGTKRYSCRWSWTTRTTTTYYSSLWWWPSDLIAIVDVAVINAGVVSLPLFHIIPWYGHWIPAHSHNYAGRVCSPPTHYTMSMPIYNHYCPPTKPTSQPTYVLVINLVKSGHTCLSNDDLSDVILVYRKLIICVCFFLPFPNCRSNEFLECAD